ncbi:hypothetical protein R1sor_020128 [Riccia sorocarpa]|uniref:Reverse transcriptase domain-containing protein n=1 Tax=Riccia sorocarpa TaxID=122646 RepID=A0ABD3IFM0_9MARC
MKAKFSRESMNSLQLQDGTITKDKGIILSEVENFMTDLYTKQQQTPETRTAVIKMIPKTEDKERLKDWRPISLMSLTYKLIAKIVAERLKKLMPDLVDVQQAGFIKGRSIVSNLLGLELGNDWAKISDQSCMFLKLDFVKAYDRVEHHFLLRTLQQYGFSEDSMHIFKGLITKGKDKVHINQDFTTTFDIARGVRQGCPLAPYLLFALTTQILMDMVAEKQMQGIITGLRLPNNKQVLQQLYADDTGIFIQMEQQVFQATIQTLEDFERASGAKLNLSKTTIIPLGNGLTPTWLTDSSCTVATTHDHFRYLGLLTRVNILEHELLQDLHQKYTRKLSHWATKLLFWSERVLLAQTVLMALPNYILMAICMSTVGIKMLERVTKDFLWGKSTTGRAKKPLIGWATLTTKKHQGGLGWSQMVETADAFLLKNAVKILHQQNEDWICLAEAIIKLSITRSNHVNDIKQWTCSQAMLGLKTIRTPLSTTLDRLLKTWFSVKKKLSWTPEGGSYPRQASLRFIHNLLLQTDTVDKEEGSALLALFKKAKIHNTMQIVDADGQRTTLTNFCQLNQVLITAASQTGLDKFETLLPYEDAADIQWHNAQGWRWEGMQTPAKGPWSLSTSQWRKLVHKHHDDTKNLNTRWELNDKAECWRQRWVNLWTGGATNRTKIRFWRFMRKGYFTNSKALSWGLDSGICKRCDMEIESFCHAIWTCPRILERQKWVSWLLFDEAERATSVHTGESVIRVVDKVLQCHIQSQAQILLLLTTWRTNWAERNQAQFQGEKTYRGIRVFRNEVQHEIEALLRAQRLSEKQSDKLHLAEQTTAYWQIETTRWFHGAAKRNPQATPTTPNATRLDTTGELVFDNATGWSEEAMIHWETSHTADDTDRPRQPHRRGTRRARTPTPDRPDHHLWTWPTINRLHDLLLAEVQTGAPLEDNTRDTRAPRLPLLSIRPRTRENESNHDTWRTLNSAEDLLTELVGHHHSVTVEDTSTA